MTTRLILASSSKPRQALLQRLQIPFEIAEPHVDESPLPHEKPSDLVCRLAVTKARAVADRYPDALIIGADQVGVIGETIQGKPHTYENAVKQLQLASGQRLRFLIGLCVLETRTGREQVVLETFDVIYRQLTDKMIKQYLQKEQPYACAGSCMADGLGITLIQAFEGDDFSALIGLPLIRLVSLLEQFKMSPLEAV
jgi:MAF protein